MELDRGLPASGLAVSLRRYPGVSPIRRIRAEFQGVGWS
jgi:hypothetical protein